MTYEWSVAVYDNKNGLLSFGVPLYAIVVHIKRLDPKPLHYCNLHKAMYVLLMLSDTHLTLSKKNDEHDRRGMAPCMKKQREILKKNCGRRVHPVL